MRPCLAAVRDWASRPLELYGGIIHSPPPIRKSSIPTVLNCLTPSRSGASIRWLNSLPNERVQNAYVDEGCTMPPDCDTTRGIRIGDLEVGIGAISEAQASSMIPTNRPHVDVEVFWARNCIGYNIPHTPLLRVHSSHRPMLVLLNRLSSHENSSGRVKTNCWKKATPLVRKMMLLASVPS